MNMKLSGFSCPMNLETFQKKKIQAEICFASSKLFHTTIRAKELDEKADTRLRRKKHVK